MVKFLNIFLLLSLFCNLQIVCMEGGAPADENQVLRREKAICRDFNDSKQYDSDSDSEHQLDRLISRTETMPSPDKACRAAAINPKPVFCEAILKTPKVNISDRFKDYINASTSFKAAFYRFTLYDIAEAIVNKKPKATLVVDHEYKSDHCEALRLLVENGIDCHSHKPKPSDGIFANLHTKFCLMKKAGGDKILWQGSWNCTGQADTNNEECVTVTNSPEAVQAFKGMFKRLRTSPSTTPITAEYCKSVSKKSKFAKELNRIPDDKMER